MMPIMYFGIGLLSGILLTFAGLRIVYHSKKKIKPVTSKSPYSDIDFLNPKFKDAGNF
ncbi:MAG TPA: hypothetical protein VHT34_09355 [Clostridia bacterium]|nr:hypothetical protein [Clostridia bacterium]